TNLLARYFGGHGASRLCPPYIHTHISSHSLGQRIGPQLELHHLAGRALAAFDVIGRAARIGRPQTFAFPASIWIIDAAIETLGVEAHRIRHAQRDELAVHQRLDRIRQIAGRHRHILAEPEGIELIDPGVVARLHRARLVLDVLELRPRELIERPAFRAVAA